MAPEETHHAPIPKSPEKADADSWPIRPHRLEDIGLLATRAAHDLNNLLTPMLIAIPILRPSIMDPAARSLLDSLENTLVRSTGLVRQVLDYAHGRPGQCQSVLMRQLVEEITNFCRETFPGNIRVEGKMASDLWPVNANLSQLYQVLLNLCVNARDAMPQGGFLTVRAENCLLDAGAAGEIRGGRAGQFLLLQVDDTGTGFSPAAMAKVSEPFSPASKDGSGSGMGLSTIRDIVVAHRGFVRLTTVAGQGSSFRIYLPVDRPTGEKAGVGFIEAARSLAGPTASR